MVSKSAAELRPRHRAKSESDTQINQKTNPYMVITKLLTKCPKNEAQSGAERFKMLQNRGLEGCCAALGGLLGHIGVGGASGEAS